MLEHVKVSAHVSTTSLLPVDNGRFVSSLPPVEEGDPGGCWSDTEFVGID